MSDSSSKLQPRAKIFFGLYILFNSIAAFLHILTSSYFGYKLTETLSAQTDDVWCKPVLQGVGNHCFSDFYSVLRFVDSPHPWSTEVGAQQPYPNPLPPFVTFILKPFAHFVNGHPSSSLGLFVFLSLLIASALIPTLHAYRTKRISGFVAILMAAMTLNAAPLLGGIDRGNVILLCIPLLYFFYIGVMESRFALTLFVSVLLVLLKPQMLLLGFIFFAHHQWKLGIKWLGATLSASLLAFALFPHDVFRNISDFFAQASRYQDYVHQGDFFPINVSFSNTVSIFLSFLARRQVSVDYVSLISIAVALFAIVSLLMLGRYRSTFHNLLIVTCLPILVPGVSFNYYLVLLLVPLLFLAIDFSAGAEPIQNEFPPSRDLSLSSLRIFNNRLIGVFLTASYVLLLIPWGIPWGLLVKSLPESQALFTGANWAIGQNFLVILFVILLFSTE